MNENRQSLVIVLPCYNEEANIGKLIQNVISQPSHNIYELSEVLFVASGCTDKTKEIVERFSKLDPRIKLISERERRGKASALNKILSTFKGDFLI